MKTLWARILPLLLVLFLASACTDPIINTPAPDDPPPTENPEQPGGNDDAEEEPAGPDPVWTETVPDSDSQGYRGLAVSDDGTVHALRQLREGPHSHELRTYSSDGALLANSPRTFDHDRFIREGGLLPLSNGDVLAIFKDPYSAVLRQLTPEGADRSAAITLPLEPYVPLRATVDDHDHVYLITGRLASMERKIQRVDLSAPHDPARSWESTPLATTIVAERILVDSRTNGIGIVLHHTIDGRQLAATLFDPESGNVLVQELPILEAEWDMVFGDASFTPNGHLVVALTAQYPAPDDPGQILLVRYDVPYILAQFADGVPPEEVDIDPVTALHGNPSAYGNDEAYDLEVVSEDEYVVVGQTNLAGDGWPGAKGTGTAFLAAFDRDLKQKWVRLRGGLDASWLASKVAYSPDLGYIVSGRSISEDEDSGRTDLLWVSPHDFDTP